MVGPFIVTFSVVGPAAGLEKKTTLKLHVTVVTPYAVEIVRNNLDPRFSSDRICNANWPCCGGKVEMLVI